ncbi:MAG: hypothetical protein K1W40_17595 [Schaedlerella sp.]|uniref:IS66 family insertion sequence element accessory protein TnpA n=1 Tax=Schaedlerella sp. TaxID=2676057 RepID=UPI00352777B3
MTQRQIQRTDQDWAALIRECRASGLSDKDWCAQHAIQVRTFYKQAARLKKKGFDIPGAHRGPASLLQEVVPLKIVGEAEKAEGSGFPVCSAHSPDLSPAVVLRFRNCCMEITNHADQSVISSAILALQQLC